MRVPSVSCWNSHTPHCWLLFLFLRNASHFGEMGSDTSRFWAASLGQKIATHFPGWMCHSLSGGCSAQGSEDVSYETYSLGRVNWEVNRCVSQCLKTSEWRSPSIHGRAALLLHSDLSHSNLSSPKLRGRVPRETVKVSCAQKSVAYGVRSNMLDPSQFISLTVESSWADCWRDPFPLPNPPVAAFGHKTENDKYSAQSPPLPPPVAWFTRKAALSHRPIFITALQVAHPYTAFHSR